MPQNHINGNIEMEGVFRATYNIFLSSELVTSTESWDISQNSVYYESYLTHLI